MYKAITSIIPSRLIYKNKFYSITDIDDDYIVNKYEIHLDDNDRIENVYIDADHPNSDPRTDIFCLPEGLKNRYLTRKLIKEIEIIIETYNMNHPYFSVWHYISYDKYDPVKYKIEHQKKDNSLIIRSFNTINKIRNLFINVID